MKSLILLVILLLAFFASSRAAERPPMRIGLFSDTHWTENPKSFQKTEAALKVFKQEKVDAIWHMGDISDLLYVKAYRHYRQTVFPSFFPENPPDELFVYANHDLLRRDALGGVEQMPAAEAFETVRKELGVPNAPDDERLVNGYPVLIFSQFTANAVKEKKLEETASKYPDKTIFVLDHCPADHTRSPYSKYPQVIHIYGHNHAPLRDENSIWQGTHTEVSAGCLHNWRGYLVGKSPESKENTDFAVMDVYPEKIIYRRFSVVTGKECKEPWIIPLPFDAKTAPYRRDFRKANTPAPTFAADAALKLTVDQPFSAVKLTWPEATQGGEVYKYYIAVERQDSDGVFHPITRLDAYSEFHLDPHLRTGTFSQAFSCGYFDSGRKYRFSVTPAGFFGQTGTPMTVDFTPPADMKESVLIFESRNPMEELEVKQIIGQKRPTAQKPLTLKDGFYQHPSGYVRIFLPEKAWKDMEGGKFRFTIDLDTRQEAPTWTMVLNNPVPFANANNRIKMPEGENIGWRYVIECRKMRAPSDVYSVLLREGGPGEFRINYVKLEKLP